MKKLILASLLSLNVICISGCFVLSAFDPLEVHRQPWQMIDHADGIQAIPSRANHDPLPNALAPPNNSPLVFALARNQIDSPAPTTRRTSYDDLLAGLSSTDKNEDNESESGNLRFMATATNIDTRVRSPLQPPVSPYVLYAGSIIPAALLTPINSDLPGNVVGHVTANVYDSISGRHLLIPQASRLIGVYNSEVEHGQNRVLIAWQRLILPNGRSIVLEAMPGTDAQGVAGMADRVDYHVKRLAGATLLSTLIALGGNLADATGRDNELRSVTTQTVAEQASRLGQQIVDRELDVQPTITVRAGMPFNVLVNKDLPLAPYRSTRKHR